MFLFKRQKPLSFHENTSLSAGLTISSGLKCLAPPAYLLTVMSLRHRGVLGPQNKKQSVLQYHGL